MSPSLTFQQALAQAEMAARRTLPYALHERLSCARAIIKTGAVQQDDDGTWQVASGSRPDLHHRVNGACSCEDAHYQAPQGLCKHRLSVYLMRRALQLMAAEAPQPMEEEMIEPYPDNEWPEEALEETTRPDQPPPLPEAPASVNVRVIIGGREVQWTLRDTDEARLAVRLEALLAHYPSPPPAQSPPQPPHRPRTGYCAVHEVEMRWNDGKDGKPGWFSHFDDAAGKWCKGR